MSLLHLNIPQIAPSLVRGEEAGYLQGQKHLSHLPAYNLATHLIVPDFLVSLDGQVIDSLGSRN